MLQHKDLTPHQLFIHIRHRHIAWAGNSKLKIYGKLTCRAGKRMKKINRVFFIAEYDALRAGFRPCAACMPQAYRQWKSARSRLKNEA